MELYYKKKEFLRKKFGAFKMCSCMMIQQKLFVKTTNSITKKFSPFLTKEQKVNICKQLCEYLHSTRDIWIVIDKFVSSIKNKIMEFCQSDKYFEKYLHYFEFACRYPKRNGMLCNRNLNYKIQSPDVLELLSSKMALSYGLCKTHSNCNNRLKERIKTSLPALPPDISKIIFDYTSRV